MKGWLERMLGRVQRSDEIRRVFGIETGEPSETEKLLRRRRRLYEDKSGLGLAASVAGELARLTTVEMKLKLSGSERAQYMEAVFEPLMKRLRRELEFGMADGSLVFKPYFDGEGIKIDVVRSECFMPISWDGGGNIVEAVFSQELKKEDVYYTRLEHHKLEGGRYIIENAAFAGRESGGLGRRAQLSEVKEWSELAERLELENVKRPLFGLFRTPSANAAEPSSPLGVSVFERAEELIAQADGLYKNMLWEFESGKRRLYVDVAAFERGSDGMPILPDTELFRTVDIGSDGFFSEWSPQLRAAELKSGLNTVLQRIEFNCSLAYGTLSEPGELEKTAEEIRASKQRSYCYVCDLQKQLRGALEDTVCAAEAWASVYSLVPEGEVRVGLEFDDGIIADRRAEYEEKLRLTELGIMQPWELRAWYFGETEAQAREAVGA